MVVVANNIAVLVVVVVLVTSVCVVYREVANGDDMSTSGGCFLRIMPAVHLIQFHQYFSSLFRWNLHFSDTDLGRSSNILFWMMHQST